ncbi:MAG: MFS transporter [Chloroflexi bacterium]|nr:MFS transporter [Chloroflexota bacterium]
MAERTPPMLAPRRRFSLRTFQSLKVRNFRYYMASSLAQMACMNMQMMASGLFMYKMTGSSALLGLTMLASAVPQLLLSPFGGIVADRVSKRLVLILGLLGSAFVALGIALATDLQIITWHYLVLSSFLQGTIMSLMMPSRQSMISELVGRDNLMNAVALNSAGMNVNQMGAPALAGFIVAGFGFHGVYYVMTGFYLLAAVLVFPVRQTRQPAFQGRRSTFGDLKDGLLYIRQNPTLLAILLLSLLTVVLSMPFRFLLPVFTEDILKVGPKELGLLLSTSGVGALIGSLVIASLGEKGRGMLFLHTGVLASAGIIAFVLSNSYALSLVIMLFVGLAQSGRMALGSTLLQSYTEDAYLGRVMSFSMMQFGMMSLGTFGISVAAEFIGVQWAVGMTAVLLALITFYYYAFSPRIRRLD